MSQDDMTKTPPASHPSPQQEVEGSCLYLALASEWLLHSPCSLPQLLRLLRERSKDCGWMVLIRAGLLYACVL